MTFQPNFTPENTVIMAMRPTSLQQILHGKKNYESRKYALDRDVKYIWFYETAPRSIVEYGVEIGETRQRDRGFVPLPHNGIGNREFNTEHADWEKYDHAFKVERVFQLSPFLVPRKYGISAPRGRRYLPTVKLEDYLSIVHVNVLDVRGTYDESADAYNGTW
jgi:hypothetical protein